MNIDPTTITSTNTNTATNSTTTHTTAHTETQWVFKPLSYSAYSTETPLLYEKSILKLKLYPHTNSPLPAPTTSPTIRISLPGSEIVVFRHSLDQKISHFHLSVEVNSTTNFAEIKNIQRQIVYVSDLLNEVWNQLWLARDHGNDWARDIGNDWDIFMPIGIRINNKIYNEGELNMISIIYYYALVVLFIISTILYEIFKYI